MIRIKNVTKYYGTVLALSNFSLDINHGELCVLIGPSGCGKTTCLKLINRLLEPNKGQVLFNGRDIKSFKIEDLRKQMGYVIQGVALFPHLTVAKNIALVPQLLSWPKAKITKRVDEMLELFSLDPDVYRFKYPAELSGGEAQRIGVARALASDPAVILMDEPFSAVDPLIREGLQDEFLDIHKKLKKTIVFVTHQISEAIKIADKIAILKDGHLIQHCAPKDLLAKPADRFVRDFLGKDLVFKRLMTMKTSDYMHIKDNPVYHCEDNKNLFLILKSELSLMDALSKLLEHGKTRGQVLDNNNNFVGEIDLAHIVKLSQLGETDEK